jgi:hypothetical protein
VGIRVDDKDAVGIAVGATTAAARTVGAQGQCCCTYGCKARHKSGATRLRAASLITCAHDTWRPQKLKACCVLSIVRRDDASLDELLLPRSSSLVRQENVQASAYVGELVSVGDGVTVGMYVVTVVGCAELGVAMVGALLLVTLLRLVVVVVVLVVLGTKVEFLSGPGDVDVSVTVSSHQHVGNDDSSVVVVLRILAEVV